MPLISSFLLSARVVVFRLQQVRRAPMVLWARVGDLCGRKLPRTCPRKRGPQLGFVHMSPNQNTACLPRDEPGLCVCLLLLLVRTRLRHHDRKSIREEGRREGVGRVRSSGWGVGDAPCFDRGGDGPATAVSAVSHGFQQGAFEVGVRVRRAPERRRS